MKKNKIKKTLLYSKIKKTFKNPKISMKNQKKNYKKIKNIIKNKTPGKLLKPPFIMANFIALSISLLPCLNADARSLAQPAVQHLSPRAEYQGGWPLALIGTASSSCPASASESCSSTVQNPACCPSGQTCIFSPSIYASYCCPTSMCIPRFTVTITFLMTSRR